MILTFTWQPRLERLEVSRRSAENCLGIVICRDWGVRQLLFFNGFSGSGQAVGGICFSTLKFTFSVL